MALSPERFRPCFCNATTEDDLWRNGIDHSVNMYASTFYYKAATTQRVLYAAEYLILITGRELRGQLLGHSVYRAVDFEILPLDPSVSVSNPPHPVEAHLLALVRSHLKTGVFLFSYDFDLTRRLQAQWVAQDSDEGRAIWEVVRMNLLIITEVPLTWRFRRMIDFSGTSKPSMQAIGFIVD